MSEMLHRDLVRYGGEIPDLRRGRTLPPVLSEQQKDTGKFTARPETVDVSFLNRRRGLCSTQNRSVANLLLQESSSRPSGYVDLASKLTDVLGCCYGWSAWHFSK